VVCIVLNNPIVVCLGCQFAFRKLISWAPLNIHKSKLAMADKHFANGGKTYNSFVFSTKLGKTYWENNFMDG
jgi:hypothetical protein